MTEVAADNIAGWPVGVEFPVAPKMAELTLEVILRTVVGATDPVRLAELRRVMPRILSMGPWATLAIANPRLQRRLPWRYVRRRIEDADRLLYAEIADRRADPDLARRTDVLAMLVRAADEDGRHMTDQELRDQLMTLLAAGHDTTATALSWALERLTRHPDVLAKAVAAAETSAAGDPAGDEYLDAVAKETLRIRPVVFDVGRVLKGARRDRRLPAARRRDGCTRYRTGPRESGALPGARPFRPRPDAGRQAGPHHLAAVRRRQPSLPGRNVRDGRDADCAARGVATGGVGDHRRRRRAAARPPRHPGAEPRCDDPRAFAAPDRRGNCGAALAFVPGQPMTSDSSVSEDSRCRPQLECWPGCWARSWFSFP